MTLRVIIACCLALNAGAVRAEDKIYLDCMMPDGKTPASLVIDLKAGIITGDYDLTITRATEGTIEFEGKGNALYEGSLDRVTGRLSIAVGDNEHTKRPWTLLKYQCQRKSGPMF
jgi:hypothetical protein